jgi:alpha-L-fucosidase 2
MALNLFDHYDFNRDEAYLRKVFPIIKGSADFILGFLITDKKGQLVTAPSMSPENSFYLQDTGKAQTMLTYAPAIDVQIIRELFANIRSVQKEMQLPAAYVKALDDVEAKLPPTRINKFGGIQEWIEDYREVEPGHRHMSQLFGLYPGTTLTRENALMDASEKTIERRLANGGGHTGWSRAWMINFFARLKQGDKAYFHAEQLLKKSTLPNLFDDHPPFQIDGNFGGTAGIAEMLLQSHNGIIDVLPAVAPHWTGEVKGLKARGGFEVDLRFENGILTDGRIISRKGLPLTLTYRGKTKLLNLSAGKSLTFNKDLFRS